MVIAGTEALQGLEDVRPLVRGDAEQARQCGQQGQRREGHDGDGERGVDPDIPAMNGMPANRRPSSIVLTAIGVVDRHHQGRAGEAICGARRGENDVPVLWGLRVESSARIWAVGSALAALDTGARSPIGRT